MQVNELENIITTAWDKRQDLKPNQIPKELKLAIKSTLDLIEQGQIRVASPDLNTPGLWHINSWIKEAILLSFRCYENTVFSTEMQNFYDKIPLQFAQYRAQDFQEKNSRIVPPATIRKGAYVGPNCVIMPSYINMGAYIGEGTMIDIWATIGSCAQIGKNVHIAAGAGIGGVLEPIQATPTIIEDNCFIGAGSQVVEGVIIEKGAVLAAGCCISQSTRIYNRAKDEISYGQIPAGAVVVPGSLPSQDGKYNLSCVVLVKQVDAKTLKKTSINELLRESI